MAKKPTPLPKSIRVGPFDVEVRPMSLVNAEKAWGLFYGNDQAIELAPNMGKHRQAMTLLHELLHAVWTYNGLSKSEDEHVGEEAVVDALSRGLAQVWRDNPELFRWFSKQFE